MKLNKSCSTCEFCFYADAEENGICANEYYGESITNYKIQRECWTISWEYFQELVNLLPQNVKNAYLNNPMVSFGTIYQLLDKYC